MKSLVSLGIALSGFLLGGCERSMIYYPARAKEEQLQELARAQGLLPWRDEKGVRIGWMTPAPSSGARAPALVVFHGNAGHAADRGYYARGLAAATPADPWQVYLFEYPGYGSRAGTPSESALTAAAREAVDALLAPSRRPLYLAGESLGSGVACRIAADRPDRVAGLLLVTPFPSLQAVAAHHYPSWLVALLLRERYDNREALRQYRGPVAVLLAGEDEVVPAELGRELYAGYAGPKRLWLQEGRTHNTLSLEPAAPWWREVVEFLQPPRE